MHTLKAQLAESLAALRDVFRNPGLRRIELAYLGSALGIYAYVIALAVYAYHHGGATAVGLLMFARMGSAAVAAPFMAGLADRYPQRRVMLLTDLTRVGTLSLTAVLAAAGATAAVYAVAVVTSVIATAFRPAEASLMPLLAETPEELAAANVVSSSSDSVAAFAGPALGAFLVSIGGGSVAFLAVAVAFAWSALFVVRLPRGTGGRRGEAGEEAEAPDLLAGVVAVRREPRLAVVIALYSAQSFVAGAYGVLVVVVSLELLGLGNAGVGILEAATGVGAVVGAAVALALVAVRRTARDLALGLVCFGLPLVAIAAKPTMWVALATLVLLGVGNSLVDISAITLVQRLTPSAVAGRVFGVLEASLIASIGVGSLATPLLIAVLGTRPTLLVAGALLPVLVVAAGRALAAIDRGATVPVEQLDALATVPFLDVLPLRRKEGLAAALEREELPIGATLFSRGQPGDRLYILTQGAIEIDLPGGPKVERAPAFVGEIALLRDVPRTATVRVVEDATFWALDGDHFLDAVTGHSRSRSAADAVVASRGAVLAV